MIFSITFRTRCIIFVIGPMFVVIVRKLSMSCIDSVFVIIRMPNKTMTKKTRPMINSIIGLRWVIDNSKYVNAAVIAEERRIFAEDIQSIVSS